MLSTCDTGARDNNYGDSSVQYDTIHALTNDAFSKTYKNHDTNCDGTNTGTTPPMRRHSVLLVGNT